MYFHTRLGLTKLIRASFPSVNEVRIVSQPGHVDVFIEESERTEPDVTIKVSELLAATFSGSPGCAVHRGLNLADEPEHQECHGELVLHATSTPNQADKIGETACFFLPFVQSVLFYGRGPYRTEIAVSLREGAWEEPLKQEVSLILSELMPVGVAYSISFEPPRTETRTRARSEVLRSLMERDRDDFSDWIERLSSGQEVKIPVVDNYRGSSVLITDSFDGAPVLPLLPLYDRVYVLVPPRGSNPSENEAEVFCRNRFGLSLKTLSSLSKFGHVVPIFRHGFDGVPDSFADAFFGSVGHEYLSPRQLDYLAMRETTRLEPLSATLRSRSDLLATAMAVTHFPNATPQFSRGPEALFQGTLLNCVHEAIGIGPLAYHFGHLYAGRFGLYGSIVDYAFHIARERKEISLVPIEFSALFFYLTLARALGATLFDGMIQNDHVFDLGTALFTGTYEIESLRPKDVQKVRRVLEGLEITYPTEMGSEECAAMLEMAETRRLREAIQVFERCEDHRELNELVLRYNQAVQKIARGKEGRDKLDLGGHILKHVKDSALPGLATAAVTQYLTGDPLMTAKLGAAGGAVGPIIMRKLSSRIGESRLGDLMDAMRDATHRVPAGSALFARLRARMRK